MAFIQEKKASQICRKKKRASLRFTHWILTVIPGHPVGTRSISKRCTILRKILGLALELKTLQINVIAHTAVVLLPVDEILFFHCVANFKKGPSGPFFFYSL